MSQSKTSRIVKLGSETCSESSKSQDAQKLNAAWATNAWSSEKPLECKEEQIEARYVSALHWESRGGRWACTRMYVWDKQMRGRKEVEGGKTKDKQRGIGCSQHCSAVVFFVRFSSPSKKLLFGWQWSNAWLELKPNTQSNGHKHINMYLTKFGEKDKGHRAEICSVA